VKNAYYEITTTTGDFIEADKPIMLTQYMPGSNQCQGPVDPNAAGDPEMFILSPLQQGIKSAIFYNTRKQNIDNNYFDLIIHKNGLPSLRVNGNPVSAANTTTHPQNSNYAVVVVRLLGAGKHNTVTSDSGFVAKVYGFGQFESYGYNLGTMINNLNAIFSIQNAYNNTTIPNTYTCPNSPFNITVRLAYKASSIKWEFSKTTGLSATTDTTLVNPVPVDSVDIAGRKYYTYKLPSNYYAYNTGIISIPVTATAPDIVLCDNTERLIYQLDVRRGPQSDFTMQHSGCTTDSALFTATPNPLGYTLDRFIWKHYDNSVDSAQTSKRKFPAGTYPVSLRVIADMGCLHDTTKSITIPPGPIAQFSATTGVCLGDSIRITDASTTVTGTSLVQWNWNFGDGTKAVRNNNSPFFH
jgi:hypothetical protein